MSDTESQTGDIDEIILDDETNDLTNFSEADVDATNNESNETENQMDDDSNTENQSNDDSNLTEPHEVEKNISLKKELEEMVQDFKNMEILPDLVAELIRKKELNTLIIDLYDYAKGFDISLKEYDKDKEIYHGRYSYAVGLIEYIRDGEIPYDIFDMLVQYKFKLYYDGYIPCQLRIHFQQEESMRSHFVLLQYTIQTIEAECMMNRKADSSLDSDTEKARLINHYSPDLCLDPNPRIAEIVTSYELNQHPFITPYLKHIIQNEKARREKGVKGMPKNVAHYLEPARKQISATDWDFSLKEPTEEEAELSKLAAGMKNKQAMASYLKERKICFPDQESYNGFHVEIENFVYEYEGRTEAGTVENVTDKFCIGVLDDKEFYYGAYKFDDKMKSWYPDHWWEIGNCREVLDLYVNAVTIEEMKMSCGAMKITHNRIFDERIEVLDRGIKIVRNKLENPVSHVILQKPSPAARNESGPSKEK